MCITTPHYVHHNTPLCASQHPIEEAVAQAILPPKIQFYLLGLMMRSVTWNPFPITNLPRGSLPVSHVKRGYLNTDMFKFGSSQQDESRTQSADSTKAYRNPRAFNCCLTDTLMKIISGWKTMYICRWATRSACCFSWSQGTVVVFVPFQST